MDFFDSINWTLSISKTARLESFLDTIASVTSSRRLILFDPNGCYQSASKRSLTRPEMAVFFFFLKNHQRKDRAFHKLAPFLRNGIRSIFEFCVESTFPDATAFFLFQRHMIFITSLLSSLLSSSLPLDSSPLFSSPLLSSLSLSLLSSFSRSCVVVVISVLCCRRFVYMCAWC